MTRFVTAIIYVAVTVWAVIVFVSGQSISSALLRPLSMVTSIVLLLSIAFELWLWKLPFLHNWFVNRPAIDGTWRVELRSNWTDANGVGIQPIHGYMVIRQTFLNLSLRLLTAESNSLLVGTDLVCSPDGQYCVSGVYRNEPNYENRGRSPIHYGAVWLRVIERPTQVLDGHYWTDRNTAGELRLTDRQRQKFQDFAFAQAHYLNVGQPSSKAA